MVVATQDQTVQSEEDKKIEEVQTGTMPVEEKEDEAVGIIGEEKEEGVSVEDILAPKTDVQKGKDGTSPGIQKRFDRLTRERNEARDEVLQLKAERLAGNKPLAPVRENYETDEEYQEDMGKWYGDVQKYGAATQELETIKESNVSLIKENNQRLVAGTEKLKDRFPNAYDDISKTPYGEAQSDIANATNSAEVALYYSLNPELLKGLKGMSDKDRYEAVTRLDIRFSQPQKKVTNAPAPIDPVKAESETTPKDIYKIKDPNAWFKERQKRERAKRRH